MSLLPRAFEGVPADFASPLDAQAALARLAESKRWAPGKPLLTGQIEPGQVWLSFATTLFLVGWLLVVVLLGAGLLWSAAPSKHEMSDMAQHLSTALQVDESAWT